MSLAEVINADVFRVANSWEVSLVNFGYKSARVTLVLKEHPGYTLDIVYNGMGKKDEFDTNVAALGSFDILNSSEAVLYYIAVGKLLEHKDLLADLKQTMKEYIAKMKEIEKEED